MEGGGGTGESEEVVCCCCFEEEGLKFLAVLALYSYEAFVVFTYLLYNEIMIDVHGAGIGVSGQPST